MFDGIPYREGSEIVEELLSEGRLVKVDRIVFDEYHYRFVEFWELRENTYMTEYDIRYDVVEEVGPAGVASVRRCNITPRHVCAHVDLDLLACTPREEWIVVDF